MRLSTIPAKHPRPAPNRRSSARRTTNQGRTLWSAAVRVPANGRALSARPTFVKPTAALANHGARPPTGWGQANNMRKPP